MKLQTRTINIFFWLIIVASLCTTVFWFVYNPTSQLETHVPGMDKKEGLTSGKVMSVSIGENFKLFSEEGTMASESWLSFRTNTNSNIYSGSAEIISNWSDTIPNIKWKVELGEGHAAPVVKDGKVYLIDYIEEEKADALRCFSLTTGNELWRRWYKVPVKRNHGLSRTVPAIKDNYIVTIGPKCHVMCCDINSGNLIWTIDLVQDFGAKVPLWYTGQCPLIDGGEVVLAPSGSALMIGVDLKSGKVNWQTPNTNDWKMSHASIMPYMVGGQKFYFYTAIGGMGAVYAEGSKKGEIAGFTEEWNPNVIAPSPVLLPNNELLVTAGYGAGAARFKLTYTDHLNFELLEKYSAKEGLASEQQTPILLDNVLFTVHPKDAGGMRNQLACYSIDNLHEAIWTSGRTDRFGLGPYIVANGKIVLLNDNGELYIIEASTSEYKKLGQMPIINGHDAWGPLVLVNGLLLMRDANTMVCVDLKKI